MDALILPTTGCVAPLLEGPINTEPFARFTRPFNLTGQPAISVPARSSGLPVGIQLIGRPGEDDHLLRIARAAELEWGGSAHAVVPKFPDVPGVSAGR